MSRLQWGCWVALITFASVSPQLTADEIGLAVDPASSQVFVIDANRNAIFDAVKFAPDQLGNACAIAADQDLAVIAGRNTVWLLDLPEGHFDPRIEPQAVPVSGEIRDILLDARHDRLLVCTSESRIETISLSEHKVAGNLHLDSGCDALASCGNDSILVVSARAGTVRQIYLRSDGTMDESGDVLMTTGGGAHLGPTAVACGSGGNSALTLSRHAARISSFRVPTLEELDSVEFSVSGRGTALSKNQDGTVVFRRSLKSSAEGLLDTLESFLYDEASGALHLDVATSSEIVSDGQQFGHRSMALTPDEALLYLAQPGSLQVHDGFSGAIVDTIVDPELIAPVAVCFVAPDESQATPDSDGDDAEWAAPAGDEDEDGDGVLNAIDNCPVTSNPDQDDADGDGVGDRCDDCPTTSNPEQGAPRLLSTPTLSGAVDREFQVTPDGSRAVFLAAASQAADDELYSSPLAGGPPTKLSGPTASEGEVDDDVVVSPDSQWAVYLANRRLYSVPAVGGMRIELTASFPTNSRALAAQFTSDSSTVVFAGRPGYGYWDLYRVAAVGGPLGNLTAALSGSAQAFQISPDDSAIVFKFREGNYVKLFSVPIAGGPPVELSIPLDGGHVSDFILTADGANVVYEAGRSGSKNLYVVPIGGGPSVQLAETERGGGKFIIDATGTRVVYRKYTQNFDHELRSVSLAGGPSVDLDSPGEESRSFKVTPDGSRVIYTTYQGLRSVPIDGGPIEPLASLSTSESINQWQISLDSQAVVYLVDQHPGDDSDLLVVPVAGGVPRRLNAPPGEVEPIRFELSPDGSILVYVARVGSRFGIFAVPVVGGTPKMLTDYGSEFRVDPTFETVVFRGRTSFPSYDMYAVDIETDADADNVIDSCDPCVDRDLDGFGDPEWPAGICSVDNCPDVANSDQLDSDFDSIGNVCDNCPTDSNVGQEDDDRDNVGNACDVCPSDVINDEDADGLCGGIDNCPFESNPNQLDTDADGAGDVCDTCPLIPDPAQPDGDSDGVGDLCDNCPVDFNPTQVDADGDAIADGCDNCPAQANFDQMDTDGDEIGNVCDLCPTDPDNDVDEDSVCSAVDNCPDVANTDQSDSDGDQLGDPCDNCPTSFNPLQGMATRLTPAVVAMEWQVSPDGTHVVYREDQDHGGTVELYSSTADGTSLIKLNGPIVTGGGVEAFEISPDGTTVIYVADQDVNNRLELFRVPITGGTPVRISEDQPFASVGEFAFSPDGETVVYVASRGLYGVPIAGGASTRLNSEQAAVGVRSFLISPDSSRVVYRSDDDTIARVELYSITPTGDDRVKLNAPSGGWISGNVEISPDSEWVVYVTDQDFTGRFEVYSVPIASGPIVRLNDTSPGVDVFDIEISPDSSTVVFLADQLENNLIELFSVPIQGGSSIRLNDTLAPWGDVFDGFKISADGESVVYRVLGDAPVTKELFSVPIEGGPSVRLHAPFEAGWSVVAPFEIVPDSSTVVYRAFLENLGGSSRQELFSAALNGSGEVKLDVEEGSDPDRVWGFDISSDGSAVVYHTGFDLYAVPVNGGVPALLANSVPSNAGTFVFTIAPGDSSVMFQANTNPMRGLFSVALVTDGDGDGVLDLCDLCPMDPAKIDPGICGCAQPDTETDPPSIECPPDVTVECGNNTDPSTAGTASATDACGPPSIDFEDSFLVGCGSSGEIQRAWSATDLLGNTSSCEQMLELVDTTPPVLSVPAPVTFECNSTGGVSGADAEVQGWFDTATVTDVCDGTVVVVDDPPELLPLGNTIVDFTATDACGNSSLGSSTISISDTIAPQMTAEATPPTLWPPKHQMVPIVFSATSVDVCDPTATAVLVAVESSQPDDAPGTGDGNTVDDVQGARLGESDFGVLLRAESSKPAPRIYTVTYGSVDDSGNVATHSTEIAVEPGDEPFSLQLAGGDLTVISWEPIAAAQYYDVVRGSLNQLSVDNQRIDLGETVCLETGSIDTATVDDLVPRTPEPGAGWFYLVQFTDGITESSYGTPSIPWPRVVVANECP